MLNSTSFGFPQVNDPTNARAIESLYSLLNDVEQRLQIVKASLTQTLPAFPGAQQPFGSFPGVGSPFAGFPGAQAYPGFSGVSSISPAHAGYTAYVPTPMGMVPVIIPTPTPGLGWSSPLGVPNAQPGFGATPFGNFRP